ncbi:MAG: hypothetical protein HFI68_00085 [Lachnospiraceae bacterium]|nr:hypothetical protein [Lachnospiraceae bacterium]
MKTKNVGFAKIEARNGQCRISISIKGAYECSGQELSLYGYGYRGTDCLLVPLGQIPVKNGMGEAVFGKQEDNLGGTGYGLNFLKGLYLRSRFSARKAYLTTWDDTVVHITALRKAPIAGTESVLQAAALGREEKQEISKTAKTEETVRKDEVKSLTGMEAFQKPEVFSQTEDSVNLDRDVAEEVSETEPVKQEPLKQELAEESPSEKGFSEQEFSEQGSSQQDSPGQELSDQAVSTQKFLEAGFTKPEFSRPESPKPQVPKREFQKPEFLKEQIKNQETGTAEEETAAGAATGRMPDDFYFREGFTELPLWECLRKILPRKRVLAEAGWEILQLHIQDIGRLPRENWTYGNNSFVLHGYFQYRYLILARRQMRSAERFQPKYQYIIGVPGIFKPQEKFMASMFGLPEFKKAAGGRDENFGFWCGSIQM